MSNTIKKNNLQSFFEQEEIEEKKEKALVIDVHNLMFRTVFPAHSLEPLDFEFTRWKQILLNSVMRSVQQFGPNRLIMAMDSRKYWRKDIYFDYKVHRREEREKMVIDFDKFFPVANEFFADFQSSFPNILFLRVDLCEADDIIAVMAREILKDVKLTNISTDKDMHQLMKNPNYEQYDPIKRKKVVCLNPQRDLDIKILTGDKSDNIPGVKPYCGPATAKKMLDKGLENELLNDTIKENYERNKRLIDFDCIPENIISSIKKSYKEYPISNYDGKKVYNFLMKHKQGVILSDLQQFMTPLKKLS